MKILSIAIASIIFVTPVLADFPLVTGEVTGEATPSPDTSRVTIEVEPINYWQEVDIVFWQTLFFATIWTHQLERQLSKKPEADWTVAVSAAAVLSFANALVHARHVFEENERTGNSH
jgi:hypothetical protein